MDHILRTRLVDLLHDLLIVDFEYILLPCPHSNLDIKIFDSYSDTLIRHGNFERMKKLHHPAKAISWN